MKNILPIAIHLDRIKKIIAKAAFMKKKEKSLTSIIPSKNMKFEKLRTCRFYRVIKLCISDTNPIIIISDFFMLILDFYSHFEITISELR